MKSVIKIVRGCMGIVYILLHIILITTPGFLIAFVVAALVSRGDGTAFRNHVTLHTTWHGAFLVKILTRILGVRITFTLPSAELFVERCSFIILANHKSTFDIPLVCYVLWQQGITALRWILKSGLRLTPFGWAAALTDCGFVRRKKESRESDLLSVARCGLRALVDKASVVLYPEGTRFRGTKQESTLRHLLPPKLGGFSALLEAMPRASILSVTFCWSEGKKGEALGRTTWNAFDLVGRSLHIVVEHVSREEVNADPKWLEAHWVRKDDIIASNVS